MQYMNSIVYTDQETLNEFYYPATTTTSGKHIKPASSWLFAAEYSQRDLFEGYDFTAGVYYKTQNNLNTFAMKSDTSDNSSKTVMNFRCVKIKAGGLVESTGAKV